MVGVGAFCYNANPAITVRYTVTPSASQDFEPLSGEVTIGSWIYPGSKGANIELRTKADNLVEGDEWVTITLLPDPEGSYVIGIYGVPPEYVPPGVGTAVVQIVDHPALASVVMVSNGSEEPDPGSQEPKPVQFRIVRSGGNIEEALTVSYSLSGTATSGEDFVAQQSDITIPAGQSSAILSVPVIDDNLPELTENLIITLTGAGSHYLFSNPSSPPQATALIYDNEPTVSITALQDGMEGETPLQYRISRVGSTRQACTVTIGVGSGGTAESADVELSASVTIPAGETSVVFDVPAVQDWQVEPTETLQVEIKPGAYWIGTPAASANILESSFAYLWLGQPTKPPVPFTTGIVDWNRDDDDNDEVSDYLSSGTVAGENDLIPVHLYVPQLSGADTVMLSGGTGKVKLWLDAQKQTPLVTPRTWSPSNWTEAPQVIYVEGIALSDAVDDVRLSLSGRTGDSASEVRLSVVGPQLTISEGGCTPDELREDDPGLWLSDGAIATLTAHLLGSLGEERTLTWDNPEKVEIRNSAGAIITSGVGIQGGQNAVMSVRLTAAFEGSDEVVFTLTLESGKTDTVKLRAGVDLDVDSNNDGTVDAVDDAIEDDSDKPGKRLQLNDGDIDDDNIPDYSDGYGWGASSGVTSSRVIVGGQFTPMTFQWAGDPNAVFTLTYDESDPLDVIHQYNSDTEKVVFGRPLTGSLRVWTSPGDAERSSDDLESGGDYIISGFPYYWSDLEADNEGKVTLWIEAVSPTDTPGSTQVSVEIVSLAGSATDTVRVTVEQKAVMVAFDGTRNYPGQICDGSQYITNVQRFANQVDGSSEFVIYERGIGNLGDDQGFLGVYELFNGDPLQAATGLDGKNIEDSAWGRLTNAYRNGYRTIDIIGFSRGAAIALDFADRLHDKHMDMGGYEEIPLVRFMGLFDVVAQFFPSSLGWDLDLSPIVRHSYHAMAYDEGRFLFPITRVVGADEEMWFRGVHGTIGASDITYNWMIGNAAQWGVPITAPAGLDLLYEQWNANGSSFRERLSGDLYYPGEFP